MSTVSETGTPLFIYVLDLFGTGAFAFSGALRVVDRRPDFVGMLILAAATAIGGGMFRDIALNRSPVALSDIGYPIVIIASVCTTFFFPGSVFRHRELFKYFDAVGLGAFSAFTAQIAWGMQLNPLALIMIAAFSGCAGGVVRDLIVQKPTIILDTDLYITPVIVGSIGLMVAMTLGCGPLIAAIIAFTLTAGLRIASIIWDVRLPRVLWVHCDPPESQAAVEDIQNKNPPENNERVS
jgi:Predicted membrane protein